MAHFVVFVFFCEMFIYHWPWSMEGKCTSYLSGGIMNGYLDHFGKGGKGCLDHNNNSHHMGWISWADSKESLFFVRFYRSTPWSLPTFFHNFFDNFSMIFSDFVLSRPFLSVRISRSGWVSIGRTAWSNLVDWVGEKQLEGFMVEHCGFDEIYCTPSFNGYRAYQKSCFFSNDSDMSLFVQWNPDFVAIKPPLLTDCLWF